MKISPRGWRNESYNHYLAAKGVKTKKYVIKYKKPAPGDHDIAMVGVDAKGRRVRVYDKEHHEAAAKEKFSRVRKLRKEYPKVMAAVNRDIESEDEQKRKNARVAYIIAKTGFRPGTRKDTKGDVQAYGVTTLKNAHVAVSGDKVRFKFISKKGVPVDTTVSDPKLAQIVKEQKAAPGPELFPNTSDATVRNYLRTEAEAEDFKTKDFRTLKATQVAEPLVRQGVQKKLVAETVAKKLHNTPQVSEKSYIDPMLLKRLKE